MQLYLYSSQDLIIISGTETHNINAGIFNLKLHENENVIIHHKNGCGSMILNNQTILDRQHSQLKYYELSKNAILCEIKPFIANIVPIKYNVNNSETLIYFSGKQLQIFYNHKYIGSINGNIKDIKFKRVDENKLGVILCGGNIILFNDDIIYCSSYIDYEINNKFIQIYSHSPNVFNVGQLTKYEFVSKKISINNVCDRGDEQKHIGAEFAVIYFLDAIKCGRFKYAHNKLSAELKLAIDVVTLQQYFKSFDEFVYLQEEDCYITLKNNKVTGIYHFVVKNNLIDNIY